MSSDLASLGIEEQVRALETVADPAARAMAMNLVASVLKLHEAGMERMLQIVEDSGGNAEALLASFRRDPLVRALLVLHDLNDEAPNVRVQQALQDLQPQLEKLGATATVLRLDSDAVSVRIGVSGHGCGSTGESIRSLVERTIMDAAADIGEIDVKLDAPDPAFVPISAIQSGAAHSTSK
jgi:Fe-S cluster biogenesis protein NfuA